MKLFIFGSTGDLVKSKVLPALQELGNAELEIWAIGRREYEREIYHSFACGGNCNDEFKKRLHYLQIDFGKEAICERCMPVLDRASTNYFYLATPPNLYKQILLSLSELKKQGYKIKILVEKPFGENLQDAKALKRLIQEEDLEKDIFISDHYLFKKGIMELKNQDFTRLEMNFLEQAGLDGRTGFYEGIGALKDMVQSHMLNTVFKVIPSKGLKIKKIEVLAHARGQCGDGLSKGYAGLLGKPSGTETFASVMLKIGKKTITLTTGKCLSEKRNELIIDGCAIKIIDKGAYTLLFSAFFAGKRKLFPKIENSLIAWEIIQKIEARKEQLFYYPMGSGISDIRASNPDKFALKLGRQQRKL